MALSDRGMSPQASAGEYFWEQQEGAVCHPLATLPEHLRRLHVPFYLVDNQGERQIALGGGIYSNIHADTRHHPLLAIAMAQTINALGDPFFCRDHQIQYPYMAGAMANGIASVELVASFAAAGLLASFGAAGLSLPEIDQAIIRLHNTTDGKPYCFNLKYLKVSN